MKVRGVAGIVVRCRGSTCLTVGNAGVFPVCAHVSAHGTTEDAHALYAAGLELVERPSMMLVKVTIEICF